MSEIREWLDYAVLQSIAETYLDKSDVQGIGDNSFRLGFVLGSGNNHPLDNPNGFGATRLTSQQITWFTANYDIVTHYPNDNTGFSATVFRNKVTGEYTLSFRSTEYEFESLGGDWLRDGKPGADGEISRYGFPLAQLSSLESFYSHLRQGEVWDNANRLWLTAPTQYSDLRNSALNVTGYSLGANLATSFTLLHPEAVNHTYTYNASGLGGFGNTVNDIRVPTRATFSQLLTDFATMMSYDGIDDSRFGGSKWWDDLGAIDGGVLPGGEVQTFRDEFRTAALQSRADAELGLHDSNIYADPLYQFVRSWLGRYTVGAGTGESLTSLSDAIGDDQLIAKMANYVKSGYDDNGFQANPDFYALDPSLSGNGWVQKITQLYGHGEFLDPEFVANSGFHAPATPVFIEDLPASRGAGFMQAFGDAFRNWTADYGETHSITLLIDSLTVLDLMQKIDSSFTSSSFRIIEKGITQTEIALSNSLSPSQDAAWAAALESMSIVAPLVGGSAEGIALALANNVLHDPDALEKTVDALGRLFLDSSQYSDDTIPETLPVPQEGAPGAATDYANLDNRNKLHNKIAAIENAMGTTFRGATIVNLVGMSVEDIAAKALLRTDEGLGYRYALRELNPFALVADASFYDRFNSSGELNLYNAEVTDTPAGMTQAYIQDRAKFLAIKLQDDFVNQKYFKAITSSHPDDWTYTDKTKDVSITLDGVGTAEHLIVFGSAVKGPDGSIPSLVGGGQSDRLYGGDGNDSISGGQGDDHLEGGLGDDDYIVADQDDVIDLQGSDTYRLVGATSSSINDVDGLGKIFWDGRRLPPGKLQNPEKFVDGKLLEGAVFLSADGEFSYLVKGADLFVTNKAYPGAVVTIRGFTKYKEDTRLGVALDQAVIAPGVAETATNKADDIMVSTVDPRAPVLWLNAPVIYTLDGGDFIRIDVAHAPATQIHAGAGRDSIVYRDSLEVTNPIDLSKVEVYGGDDGDVFQPDRLHAVRDDGSKPEGLGARFYGEQGNDYFGGSALDEFFSGGDGHDVAQDDGGNDALDGGAGNDWLEGGDGVDIVIGGEGNDIVLGGAGQDTLIGGAGADRMYGDSDGGISHLFNGTLGWDGEAERILWPNFGGPYPGQQPHVDLYDVIDASIAQQSDDRIYGGDGNDTLYGGAGNDRLYGEGDNDLLYGEAGDDQLDGGDGDDVLWGDKNPDLVASDAAIYLTFNETDSNGTVLSVQTAHHRLYRDAVDVTGNDMLTGGAGNDRLYGGGGNDVLDGGIGNDVLDGGDGADILRGGEGDDKLLGGKGDDVLDGGRGHNQFVGGAGNDTYFVTGGGNDTVDDDSGDNDRVSLDVASNSVSMHRTPDDNLVIQDKSTGEVVVTIRSHFAGHQIEGIAFSDGVVMDAHRINLEIVKASGYADNIQGSNEGDDIPLGAGDDLAFGRFGNDRISGGVGNDTIQGNEGDDALDGGEGNDVLVGGAGADSIVGGTGADVLIGDADNVAGPDEGADVLDGGDGNDYLAGYGGDDQLDAGAGNDQLYGGAGNDLLRDGAGDDLIVGGEGNDRYEVGAGNDTIIDTQGDDRYVLVSGFGVDVLEDQDGVDEIVVPVPLSQLSFLRDNCDLLIQAGTDQLRIVGWYDGERIERIITADGVVLAGNEIASAITHQTGTAGDDLLQGEPGLDDVLQGGSGNDRLVGDSGNDDLDGGSGNDVLDAGAGDDILRSGGGDDVLLGGAGSDEYIVEAGHVRISDGPSDGSVNTLRLAALAGGGSVDIMRFGNDLQLKYAAGTVVIDDYYADRNQWVLLDSSGTGIDLHGSTPTLSDAALVDAAWNVFADRQTARLTALAQGLDSAEGWSRPSFGTVQYTKPGSVGLNSSSSGDVRTSISRYTVSDGMQFWSIPVNISGKGVNDIAIQQAIDNHQPIVLEGLWFITQGPSAPSNQVGAPGSTVRASVNFPFIGVTNYQFQTSTANGSAAGDVWGMKFDQLSFRVGLETVTRWAVLGAAYNYASFGNGGITYSRDVIRLDDISAATPLISTEQGYRAKVNHSTRAIDLPFIELNEGDDVYSENLPPPRYIGEWRMPLWQWDPVRRSGAVAWELASPANPEVYGDAQMDFLNVDDVYRGTAPTVIDGGDGNDRIYANPADNFLRGGSGDDVLFGFSGNDVLAGEKGSDRLEGGYGQDLYLIGATDVGIDIVLDDGYYVKPENASAESSDVMQINVKFSDVNVTRVQWGADREALVFAWGDSTQRRGAVSILKGANDPLGYGVEVYRFLDGEHSLAELLSVASHDHAEFLLPISVRDVDATDWIRGSSVDDDFDATRWPAPYDPRTVVGLSVDLGAGDDRIVSGEGDDVLSGGRGDDILQGGGGNDTYLFSRGDGRDTIIETLDSANKQDRIVFDASIQQGDVKLTRQGDDLLVEVSGTADSITVKQFYAATDALHRAMSRLQFADGSFVSAETIFAMTSNSAPVVATKLNDVSVAEDALLEIALGSAFSDPDVGDVVQLSVTRQDGGVLPIWLRYDPVRQALVGTPGNEDVGVVPVVVSATDKSGALASQTFNVTVSNTNDAPIVANPIANQNATEDAQFNLVVPANTFADVDVGDSLSLTATRADGTALPTWLQFDPATRSFAGIPGNSDVGSVGVKVTATDRTGASVSSTFVLDIANTNDAPMYSNPIPGIRTNEDAVFSYVIPLNAFTDVDAGDTLSFVTSLSDGSPLPAWLTFNPATRTLSGTPVNDNVGSLKLRITATDTSGASASGVFALDVINVNDMPVVTNPISNQAAQEGVAFTYTLTADVFTDVDVGDTLKMTASMANGAALPAWLTFNNASRTFSGTPPVGAAGVVDLRVTASDTAGASVSDIFQLAIASSNLTLVGTNQDETLIGSVGDDLLDGRGGRDTLRGMAGNDTLQFNRDGVWASGSIAINQGSPGVNGSGDTVNLTGKGRSLDTFDGGAGTDILLGTANSDVVALDDRSIGAMPPMLMGVEAFTMGDGDDVVDLTSSRMSYGNVTIDGGNGNDVLWSNAGNDVLLGGAGNDVLVGAAGNDVLDGGVGADTMKGGVGNDTYYVDNTGDVTTENANEGEDFILSSITRTLGNNFEHLFLVGAGAVNGTGNALANWLKGNDAVNSLTGNDGNDTLSGAGGNDVLNGGNGTDILQGGLNDDSLTDTSGNGLLDGGAGIDMLVGGSGRELYIGGTGNDTITTGNGADIIAFNKGDGADTVNASMGSDDTLSIGGGVRYADMVLSKSGLDLILGMGSGDQITLKNWYQTGVNNRSIVNLQMVVEAMSDFNASSSDPLRNRKITQFNFLNIVSKFDAARAANAKLTNWAVSNAIAGQLVASSDTAALGGDLAYQYGKAGTLANIGATPAQSVLSSASFATAAQMLQPIVSLQTGTVRLS